MMKKQIDFITNEKTKRMTKKMTTLSFRLEEDLKDVIIDHAIDRWSTPSKIVHKIIKNYYETELSRKTAQTTSKGNLLSNNTKDGTGTSSASRKRIS